MKPGYKTTEFWLTLLANFMPFLSGAGLDPQATAVIGAVTAGVYTAGRSYSKAKGGQ